MTAPIPPGELVLKEVERRVRHALSAYHVATTERSPATSAQMRKNVDDLIAWALEPLTKEAPNGR